MLALYRLSSTREPVSFNDNVAETQQTRLGEYTESCQLQLGVTSVISLAGKATASQGSYLSAASSILGAATSHQLRVTLHQLIKDR